MSEPVIELFEVVEFRVSDGVLNSTVVQISDLGFQTSSGEQAGERVGVGLGLGDLEGSEHGETLRGPSGYYRDVTSARAGGGCPVGVFYVYHPRRVAADADWHARR